MPADSVNSLPTVYIVDDTADYRFMVQQVFVRYMPQYNVSFFEGGEPLLSHLQANADRPTLILLDLHMPGMGGQQTLVHLKQEPSLKRIPVVVVTSSSSAREVQACYEAGANSCLVKSVGLDEMRQQLEQVCRYWLDTNRPVGP